MTGPDLSRFVEDPHTGCHNWTGHIDRDGYGHAGKHFGTNIAHRLVYIVRRGPIPAGMHVDHLCRNRRFVNPDHLEAVTPRQNNERGFSVSAVNSRKRVCVNGHDLAVFGRRTLQDERACRECNRINNQSYRAKVKKQEAGNAQSS